MNSSIIAEKCSARIRTYIHTSMQHAIDRKAIRSGLSVVPFITLPGSLLRENPPARLPMESPHRAFTVFFSRPLAYGLFISLVPYLFFLRSKLGFLRCRKSRVERCSIRVKVKELVTVPNIFILDVLLAIPDKRRLRVFCSMM